MGEVQYRWLDKMCRMIGQEFFLGRAEYRSRTEKITQDGVEYVRHVHEMVPFARQVVVHSINISNYDHFTALAHCHHREDRFGATYQVPWSALRDDEESARRDAEQQIRESANKLALAKRDPE